MGGWACRQGGRSRGGWSGGGAHVGTPRLHRHARLVMASGTSPAAGHTGPTARGPSREGCYLHPLISPPLPGLPSLPATTAHHRSPAAARRRRCTRAPTAPAPATPPTPGGPPARPRPKRRGPRARRTAQCQRTRRPSPRPAPRLAWATAMAAAAAGPTAGTWWLWLLVRGGGERITAMVTMPRLRTRGPPTAGTLQHSPGGVGGGETGPRHPPTHLRPFLPVPPCPCICCICTACRHSCEGGQAGGSPTPTHPPCQLE